MPLYWIDQKATHGQNLSESIFVSGVNLMCSDTFTTMCLSLGTKIGVMDKMLSYEEPKTCKEIADDAGLKERWENKLFTALKI